MRGRLNSPGRASAIFAPPKRVEGEDLLSLRGFPQRMMSLTGSCTHHRPPPASDCTAATMGTGPHLNPALRLCARRMALIAGARPDEEKRINGCDPNGKSGDEPVPVPTRQATRRS